MKHTPLSLIRDIRAFNGIKKVREEHFSRASSSPIEAPAGAIELGRELHPDRLKLTVSKKTRDQDGNISLLLRGDGVRLPAFRPGQYIDLLLGGSLYPFFLSGSAKDALRGFYEITVAPASGVAFACLDTLREGDCILSGPPTGYFFYRPIRDGSSFAVIADRSAVGAALAMSKDDVSDLFLCGTNEDIPDDNDISADTVFICGKRAFCAAASSALEKRKTRVLFTDAPSRETTGEVFLCTVITSGGETRFECCSNEPLINALERNKILLFNKCLTGDCSFCRARLIEGQVSHIFDAGDSRRKADIKFGYIHPCRAFPDSDVTLKY